MLLSHLIFTTTLWSFPGGSDGKESACDADLEDTFSLSFTLPPCEVYPIITPIS